MTAVPRSGAIWVTGQPRRRSAPHRPSDQRVTAALRVGRALDGVAADARGLWVAVLSAAAGSRHPRLRRVLVAPCTTTVRGLPSEVVLEPGDDPIPRRSAVNLDSVESVFVGVLVERLGRLADARMREICRALSVAVDCEA